MNYDTDFLLALDKERTKEKYARITVLDLKENPVETIEGKVTGGSLNIDGASSLRRTCSLTVLAYNEKITDYYWGLTHRFKLEIGIKNMINKKYPDTIWFNQGVYIITGFSTSQSGTSYTVSISGKDKMCALNGDVGGVFPFQVDFGKEEIYTEVPDTGEIIYTIKENTLFNIVREMVHVYGGEPYYNIIINDLDTEGLELMEYRGDTPLFVVKAADGQMVATLNKEQKCYYDESIKTFGELADKGLQPLEIKISSDANSTYQLSWYAYGETIGYKITDLVYTGDLIANVGETVVSVLDKIVNMLGEYEYFYDLDGRFIFQKKKTYIQTAWTPLVGDGKDVTDFFIEPTTETGRIAYSFYGNELITALSNSPKLDNIKNDYSIWGTKKSATGKELDVHLRYAVHSKPGIYTTVEVTADEVKSFKELYPEFTGLESQQSKTYVVEEAKNEQEEQVKDWRELIYIMAQDYSKYSHFDNFEDKVWAANPETCPLGRTGYEQYYTDMLGFWRQLYDPEGTEEGGFDKDTHWTKTAPESLEFWIDFLDPAGDLEKFSVQAIGSRPKATTDKDVKALAYRETPNLIFYSPSEVEVLQDQKTGYTYVQLLPQMNDLVSISSQGKSAKDTLDNWINNYLYGAETISITAIPIYYLEPNTRLKIADNDVSINGEYIIDKISLPLTYNGTMTISATKTIPNLY